MDCLIHPNNLFVHLTSLILYQLFSAISFRKMKPGLAVLPMDVWADVFVFPWINRQKLAQIVDQFKESGFAEKLQKFLNDPKCGKHSLRHLRISYKPLDKPKKNPFKFQLRKRKIPQYRAYLAVTDNQLRGCVGGVHDRRTYKDCEFPECEMPENIKAFKLLTVGYLDAQVLDFLHKIKPLFTDVIIHIGPIEWEKDQHLCVLFGHLLPMLSGIRRISGGNYHLHVLERQFPGTMARAKELEVGLIDPASIPTYLDWLDAPLNFDQQGPRFLKMDALPIMRIGMIDYVHKHFLATTSPATFVILIDRPKRLTEHRVEEFNIENAATNEQLTVRKAHFKEPKYGDDIHYVEIMRHPKGANAKMREWMKQRAYYEKKYKQDNEDDSEKQVISMNTWPRLTIGQITNEADGMYQDEDNGNASGPSTSAAKKTCIIS